MFAANNKEAAIKDAKSAARNAKEAVRDAAYDTEDNIRDAANNAGRSVRAVFSNATEELVNATDTVKTQIRNKPVQSTLIALGAGFVIGLLARR